MIESKKPSASVIVIKQSAMLAWFCGVVLHDDAPAQMSVGCTQSVFVAQRFLD
jgi:hypothetical protein